MSEAMKPGRELDAKVAQSKGLVACDGWRPINMGAAGGPCLLADCNHEPGTCYSTTEIGAGIGGGKIGGPLRYSTDWSAAGELLEEMAAACTHNEMLWLTNEGHWACEFTVGNLCVADEKGETGPHAIALAYLAWKEQQ